MARVLNDRNPHLERQATWWRRILRPGRARRYRAGLEGEQRVARQLARLPRRYLVYNNYVVPGHRANIDHVVVSRRGIIVLETKSLAGDVRYKRGQWLRRKRTGGRRTRWGPWRPVGDPAEQVQRAAKWLHAALNGHLGTHYLDPHALHAIIVFAHPHGRVKARRSPVPVVGLRRVRRTVKRAGRRHALTRDDVRRIEAALRGYAR